MKKKIRKKKVPSFQKSSQWKKIKWWIMASFILGLWVWFSITKSHNIVKISGPKHKLRITHTLPEPKNPHHFYDALEKRQQPSPVVNKEEPWPHKKTSKKPQDTTKNNTNS